MLKTTYISNCTENDIDELKIASLYFDKIEIKNNVLYSVKPENEKESLEKGGIGIVTKVTNFVSERFFEQIYLLIQENVISISNDTDKNEDKLWREIDLITNKILSSERSILFEETVINFFDNGKKRNSYVAFPDEVKNVHAVFVNPLSKGRKVDINFIVQYYSLLLNSLLVHISKGEQCLTSSDVLNKFLCYYQADPLLQEKNRTLRTDKVTPNLALNALKLAVPNISSFPFEEILETRVKANSELLQFRNELETFQFNLQENYSLEEIHTKAEEIVKHKLNPSLVDLKRKIETLKLKLPKIIIDQFKDPKSYTPLIGTFLGAIPTHIATLLSLGLISLSAAYEYVLSRKEIRENGLYYLIKLNKKYG